MGYLSPALAARNMKKSIEFYRDILGFKLGMVFPDEKKPEYADLCKDGMSIMLIPARNVGVRRGARVGTGVNLYMEIDGDIDEYYRDLKGKGVAIICDIRDEPFGIRDFTITDPDGYQLTFNKQLQAK